MSNIVYSNVPPMMEAIRNGDIDKLKSQLHAGYSPNELQHYQVNFDDWPRVNCHYRHEQGGISFNPVYEFRIHTSLHLFVL